MISVRPNIALAISENHQSHDAGALDGIGQLTLVTSTNASAALRQDLAVEVSELLQAFDILVVDVDPLILTEPASLSSFNWLSCHKLN